MSEKKPVPSRILVPALAAACLLSCLALPARAEGETFLCRGEIVDAYGRLAVGYRVVFLQVGGAAVTVSAPTDAAGEYRLRLPEAVPFAPIAVIAPTGLRIELNDQAPVHHVPNAPNSRVNLQIATAAPSDAIGKPGWFPGSDRLFLAFVEDADHVDRQRWEVQLDAADFDSSDVRVSRVIAAFQFFDLPQVEVGGRLGFGGVDNIAGVRDETGMTDLDVWGKLRVGSSHGARADYAVGALLTLPTGDEDTGLGFDALRSELFGAMRYYLTSSSISAHLGVRVNEDGQSRGRRLQGRVAPTAGVGFSRQVLPSVAVILEAVYEGKRFEGGDADLRALAGINWNLSDRGALRIGLAAGLADGAPDTRLLIGYSFDF